jgi:ligand-binding sensor domain-containing protein
MVFKKYYGRFFKKVELRFCLLVLLYVFGSFYSLGQTISNIGSPKVVAFSKYQFGGHRQSWGVAKSSVDGNLYFANSNGLLKYDGGRWKLFQSDQILRSVCVDSKGRIFTGALGEFGEWVKNEIGDYVYKSYKSKVPEARFLSESVWNIIESDEGIIFQSFAFAFLLKNDGNITKLNVPSNIFYFVNLGSKVLAPTIGKGLYFYKKGKFSEITGSKSFFENESIVSAFEIKGKPNELMVCTAKGVFLFENQKIWAWNENLNRLLSKYKLNKAIGLPNGQFAFGTLLNGIIVTDANGNVKATLNKSNGLLNNTVLSLAADFEGNIWAGLDNGIAQVQIANPLRFYQDVSGELGSVYDAAIFKGKLYVGSNQGLFYRKLDTQNEKFILIPNTQGQVWSLDVFDNQLFCGHNDGTFLVDEYSVRKISDVTGGWSLKQLNSETLIQATYTQMVLFRKQANGRWQLAEKIKNAPENIRHIELDESGDIWLNNTSGEVKRIRLNGKKNEAIQMWSYRFASKKNFKISKIRNQIYLTSGKEVYVYSNSKRNFVKDNRFENNLNIIRIFNAPSGQKLAISTSGMMMSFTKTKTLKKAFFDENSFVEGSENVKILYDEFLFFCLEEGFALGKYSQVFDENNIIRKKPKIVGFETEDDSNIKGEAKRGLTFSYENNSIIWYFKPPGYSQSVQYSYRLLGKENSWSPFQHIDYKLFNNLSAGNYTLQLKSNIDDEIDEVSFEISPPWFWSWWTKVIYGLLFMILVYALDKYQIRNLAKQKAKLEEAHRLEVEHQQQEIIRMRNERLEKDIIRKSEELANSTMQLIKKNELLTQLKEEVNKVEKNKDTGLVRLIDKNISNSQDWKVFETNFNQVHESFLKKLQHDFPDLSHGDLKLAAYLRMNLSTKEIAQLLNITIRSVELKRYRLRKKLGISSDENLNDLMMSI